MARLVMGMLLMLDVPKLASHDGWYFRHGGDASLYVELGIAIDSGHPKPTTVGAGLPLLIALIHRLAGGETYYDFLPYLVPLNGFLLAGASVWIVGQTALYLSGSCRQALLAAAVWIFLGYALWLGLGLHWDAENLRDAHLSRQMWMNGITDPPSLFLAMLGLMLTVRAYSASGNRALMTYAFAGAAFGLGCAFRIHTAAIAAAAFAALLWNRRWSGLAFLAAGFVVGFSPQLWHNAVTSPSIINTPYLSGWLGFSADGRFYFRWNVMPISPGFFRDSIAVLTRGNWLVAIVELALLLSVAYAFARCWRHRGSFAALVMFGAPAASLALHVTTFVFAGDPIRFSLPAISVGLPAAVWAADSALELARILMGRFQLRFARAES
ncbi:MAG: hypothetical protein FJ030_06920 [Chloroflexi bacterium]|nr:hypothetical protein [Chloroflexota bacterium]